MNDTKCSDAETTEQLTLLETIEARREFRNKLDQMPGRHVCTVGL